MPTWIYAAKLPQAETLLRGAIRIFEGIISEAEADGEQAPAGYRENLAVCQGHLGRLLGRDGRHDQAEQLFRAAIEGLVPLAPGSPRSQDRLADAYRYRGTWLNDRGQREQAAIEFGRALDLWRNLASAPLAAAEHRARLARFLVDCVQTEFRDPRAAVRLGADLTAEVPQNPEYWSVFGAALVRDGQHEQAIEALERAIRLRRTDHARERFFLALVYAKTGRMNEANDAYTQARQWLEQNLPQHEELRRLQQEAAAVLEAAAREGVGSRFRVKVLPCGSSLPENDSRPRCSQSCKDTLIDKKLLAGCLQGELYRLTDFSDLLLTFCELPGAPLPEGVTIDGRFKLYADGRLFELQTTS